MSNIVDTNIKTHICELKQEVMAAKKDARKARFKLQLLNRKIKLYNKLITKTNETE